MEELFLWKFHWDCGRMGDLNGVFLATKSKVENAVGKEVYFGEVLGKHSEIYGKLDQGEITVIEVSKTTIIDLEKVFGKDISGHNPLYYAQQTCDECGYKGSIDDFKELNLCYECAEKLEKENK